jgi:hypothetical protein
MSKRYAVFVSQITKKVCLIDLKQARLDRLRRRVKAWSHSIKEQNFQGCYMIMIRLSYNPENEWKENNVREFMMNVRKELGPWLKAYAWVAELQKRGAVHYHVVLVVRKGIKLKKPDKSGSWKYGSTNISRARSPFYLMKYTGKEYQKDYDKLPKGARAFAVAIMKDEDREILKLFSLKRKDFLYCLEFGWQEYRLEKRRQKIENGWYLSGLYVDELEASSRVLSLKGYFESEAIHENT